MTTEPDQRPPLTVADLDEAAQAIPAEEYLDCEFCDERVNPHLFSEHRNTHVRKSPPAAEESDD